MNVYASERMADVLVPMGYAGAFAFKYSPRPRTQTAEHDAQMVGITITGATSSLKGELAHYETLRKAS